MTFSESSQDAGKGNDCKAAGTPVCRAPLPPLPPPLPPPMAMNLNPNSQNRLGSFILNSRGKNGHEDFCVTSNGTTHFSKLQHQPRQIASSRDYGEASKKARSNFPPGITRA